MSKDDVEEIVSRFFASCQPREREPSAEKLAQISEDARQSLELAPPSDCVEWWSALPEAVQQKWLAEPKTTTMYGAWCECRKRQKAVNYARASVGLEGFKLSEAEEQRAARFVAGEIDLAEFAEPAHAETVLATDSRPGQLPFVTNSGWRGV